MLGSVGGRGHLHKSVGARHAQVGARHASKLLSVKTVLRNNSMVRMFELNHSFPRVDRNSSNFSIPRKELSHIVLSELVLELQTFDVHVERK